MSGDLSGIWLYVAFIVPPLLVGLAVQVWAEKNVRPVLAGGAAGRGANGHLPTRADTEASLG